MEDHSLKIFVVENHGDTLEYLQMYLEQLGHTVLSAGTMDTALREIPASHCDVLISDIGLPDGTGWELIEKLGENRPPFTVAMSGFGMNADVNRSKAAGVRHHLVKPFHPEELDRLLQEAMNEIQAR